MSQFNINSTCEKSERLITISGVVLDTNTQEVLPFANIYLSNNESVGTAANNDGEFTIEIPEGSLLKVSYAGYFTYEFKVKEGYTKVFLVPDDQLGTVYLEGNKKKKSGWLWWLGFGALAIAATSGEETPKTNTTRTPIKAKI